MISRSAHVKNHVSYLGLMIMAAAALTVGAATPSFAQVPGQQAPGAVVQTPERTSAIHDCSVEASKWSFSTWQTTQIITYDDCMTNHGQPE